MTMRNSIDGKWPIIPILVLLLTGCTTTRPPGTFSDLMPGGHADVAGMKAELDGKGEEES